MSSSVRATVLYDAPGPRGRRLNTIITVVTTLVALAVLFWVGSVLQENGQLDGDKWTPFIDPQTWTTYLLPGLWGTLKAAVASILLALVMGTLLGLGRISEIRLLRWFCAIIIETFRAIPVLILMIFAYQLFARYQLVPSRLSLIHI